jgi:uncharacterized protein YraI
MRRFVCSGYRNPRPSIFKFPFRGVERALMRRVTEEFNTKREIVMRLKSCVFVAALTATTLLAVPASAATVATAMTPLNIRSGPGPQFTIIGAIPQNGRTVIMGCIRGSLWCQVSFDGRQGWAYAQYLTAQLAGRSLIVAEDLNAVPQVTYQAPIETTGTAIAAPAITGTLIARPRVGEPLVIAPPPATVGGYVVRHPVPQVYLNGEVVEGAGLPDDVVLSPVPGSDYQYAYVNNAPVLVQPATRRIEYIYR